MLWFLGLWNLVWGFSVPGLPGAFFIIVGLIALIVQIKIATMRLSI